MEKEGKSPMSSTKKYWKLLAICLAVMLLAACVSSVVKTAGGSVLIREVNINTRGGTLSGMIYVPKSALALAEDGSYAAQVPAVVLSEGYLNSNQMQDPNAIEFARRGFVVFSMDMYGHGNSDLSNTTDDPSNSGSVLGAIDAFNYVKTLPYVDKTRIGLIGHSMGGMNIGNAAAFEAGFFTEQDMLLNLLHDEFGVDVTAADVAAQDAQSLADQLSDIDKGRYEVLAAEIHQEYIEKPFAIMYMGSGPGFAGLSKAHVVEVAGNEVWRDLQCNVADAIGIYEENAWLMFSSADDGINNSADLPNSTVAHVLYGTIDEPVLQREWYSLNLSDTAEQVKSTDLGSFDSLTYNDSALYEAAQARTARVMYQPKEIHIMNHFSHNVTSFAVQYMMGVMGYNNGELAEGAQAIDPSNSVWLIKEIANGIELVAMFILVVPVALLVVNTPFFKSLKKKPGEAVLSRKDPSFWITSAVIVAVAALTLIPFMKLGGAPTTYAGDKGPIAWSALFSQEMSTRCAVWALLNGLICLVILAVKHFIVRKDGISFSERYGLKISAADLGKTVLVALTTFAVAYLANSILSFFFNGSDVRFWIIAGRVMTANQFITWAGYLVFFFVFYYINSMVVNSGRMKDMSTVKNIVVCALINGAGIFLLAAFHYGYELIAGHMIWYNFGHDYFLYLVVVLPMIIELPVAAVYSKKLYEETSNIYLGAFINTFIFTWFVVGNTCYHFSMI